MADTITEKIYPIEFAWVYKSLLAFFIAIVVSILMFIFGYYNFYLLFLILYTPIHFVITILRWKNFHYALESKFMILRQGILSKQERNLPYGVIQNVFVKQDLFDRIFGLASVAIENAAVGAGAKKENKFLGMKLNTEKRETMEMVGFSGNKVTIPGLKKANAEKLKEAILSKVKQNPIEDSQSGL